MSRVHYDVAGAGPTIVLISGLGGLGSFWAPVIPLLATSARVVTFDHPGLGRSAPSDVQTIPNIAASVIELLDTLHVSSAHIVGHSTGSVVGQTLALDYRSRVNRLVLSGGWAQPDARFRDLFAFRRFLLEKVGPGAYAALSLLGGYDSEWYSSHLAGPLPPNFKDGGPADTPTVVKRLNMLLEYNRADDLGQIDAPTLVMGAKDDFIVPFHHSRDLAARIADSLLVDIAGGHFFPQVVPESFCKLVSMFLGLK
ncbi:alpha/beta fold hydrolase [Ralstonia sp. VS2407]